MTSPGPGHNTPAGGIDADRLRNLVERIEAHHAERKLVNEAIKDMMAEAKSAGFDLKALRAAMKIKASDKQEHEAFEMQRDLYLRALGV